jgi:hypothetical protein
VENVQTRLLKGIGVPNTKMDPRKLLFFLQEGRKEESRHPSLESFF